MGLSILTLIAARKYIKESLLGGGAVVGKNVTISSITPIDGGNEVTFSYTLDSGQVKYSTLQVMDGKPGRDGINGKDGSPGKDGFSPIITTSLTNNDTDFRIIIKDANGTQTSPNLMPSVDMSNVVVDVDIEGTNLIVVKGNGNRKVIPLPVINPNPGGDSNEVNIANIIINNSNEIEIVYDGIPADNFPSFEIDFSTGELNILDNGNYNITFGLNDKELEVSY